MISLLRGRERNVLEFDATMLRVHEEARLAEQQAEQRLMTGKQTMRERLVELLGDKQSANLSAQGLHHFALHRVPALGGVLVEHDKSGDKPSGRINFDLTSDDCLEIATHGLDSNDRFRYVKHPQGVFFEAKDTHESLTSPLAQEGLRRLEDICERLGSICLYRAS